MSGCEVGCDCAPIGRFGVYVARIYIQFCVSILEMPPRGFCNWRMNLDIIESQPHRHWDYGMSITGISPHRLTRTSGRIAWVLISALWKKRWSCFSVINHILTCFQRIVRHSYCIIKLITLSKAKSIFHYTVISINIGIHESCAPGTYVRTLYNCTRLHSNDKKEYPLALYDPWTSDVAMLNITIPDHSWYDPYGLALQ